MLKKNITIIDADSIVYILAYKFKDVTKITKGTEIRCSASVDSFVTRILRDTNADAYLGFFGTPGGKPCFRYERAETHAYKHARKEKEDWFKLFQPLILKRLIEGWKFTGVEGYEADDYVCQAACLHRDDDQNVTVAAIDKDIRQVTGVSHYTYNPSGLVTKAIEVLTDAESFHQLYFLMLAGDVSDGYAGIPGIGKKKAGEILDGCETEVEFQEKTRKAFKYWFTEGLIQKEIDKILKDHYTSWKISNNGSRLTKAIKDEIYGELDEFFTEMINVAADPKNPTWENRYNEMYDLAKLPDSGDYIKDITIPELVVNKLKIKTASRPQSITDLLDSIT